MASTIQGPILSVSASFDDLRQKRNDFRTAISDYRIEVVTLTNQIREIQRQARATEDDDEKAAFQQSINNLQRSIEQKRELIVRSQKDIQQITQNVPSLPLKVDLGGFGKDALEALSLVRDQFGELLGPLNGVTGRISSLIETFKTLGKIAGESSAETAAGIAKMGAAGEAAGVGLGETTAGLGEVLAIGAAVVISVATIAGALFEAGKSTAELAHQYEILAQRAGVTAQDIQGMTLVAKVSGTSIDEFALTLERLSFRLSGSGGRGGGVASVVNQVQSAIEIMIGSVKNAAGQFLSPIDIFKRLADQFAIMPDGVAKTALAMELFGRSGASLIPTLNLGSAAIDTLIRRANELGISIDGQPQKYRAWQEAMGELGLAWDSLKEDLASFGFLTVATNAVNLFTGALESLKNTSDQIHNSLGLALKDTFEQNDISTLSKKGQEQAQAIIDALSQKEKQVNRQGQTAYAPQLPSDLFSPEQQTQIEESLKAIHTEMAGITDEGAKNVALQVRYRQLVQDLVDQGVIEQKNAVALTLELQQQSTINARTVLASPASVAASAAFRKEVETANKELQTLDEKTNIFGDHASGAFKKGQASLDDLKKRIIDLRDQINSVGDVPKQPSVSQAKTYTDAREAAAKLVPQLKQATQEYTQALAAQEAEVKRLATEMDSLQKKYAEMADKQLKSEQAQLSAAADVSYLTQQLRVNTDAYNLNWVSIDKIASKTTAGAEAVKIHNAALATSTAATNAVTAENKKYSQSVKASEDAILALKDKLAAGNLTSQQTIAINRQIAQVEDAATKAKRDHIAAQDELTKKQLESTRAVIIAAQAELTFLEATGANVELIKRAEENLKQLQDTYKELESAINKARAEQTKFDEEQSKSASAIAAVQGRVAKLNEEYDKAVAEYNAHASGSDKVVNKLQTLRQELALHVTALEKDTAALAEAKRAQDALVDTGAGSAEIKQADDDWAAARAKQIQDVKEITRVQGELAKETPTLATAFEQLTQIVGQFSGGLPAPLVRIVAMLKAFQSLIDLIQRMNLTKINPINIPGTAGGAAGTGGGGAQGGFGGLLSGITGSDAGQAIISGGSAGGIGAGIGGQVGGTAGAIGGGIAGIGALSTIESLSSAGGALTGTAGLAGIGVLGPIGLAIGAALAIFGVITQKIKAKTAEIAKQISASFQTIVDQYNAGNTSLVNAIAQTEKARADAIAQLSSRKGGQDQLATLIPQFDQEIAQLQAAQKQILDTFNKLAVNLSFPTTVQSSIKTLQDLNDQVKQFIDAGGNAATAAQVFAASVNQLKGTTADSLLQSEQGVISAMLQENDLIKQRADLIKSTTDQINGILNQGVLSRSQSTAQTQAQQIQTIRDNANTQLAALDDQKSALDAQIAGQQQLFGLTTDVTQLKATQLAIEKQISAEQAVQIAGMQKLLQQLQALPPGATSVNLGALATGQGSAANAQLQHDQTVTALQQQLSELQVELKDATNANGYTNQDRLDLRKQISDLQAQLAAAIKAPVVQAPDTGVAAASDTTIANAILLALGGAGGLSNAIATALKTIQGVTLPTTGASGASGVGFGNVSIVVNGSNLTPDQLTTAIEASLLNAYKALQGNLQA